MLLMDIHIYLIYQTQYYYFHIFLLYFEINQWIVKKKITYMNNFNFKFLIRIFFLILKYDIIFFPLKMKGRHKLNMLYINDVYVFTSI